jgi:hypothetical protein
VCRLDQVIAGFGVYLLDVAWSLALGALNPLIGRRQSRACTALPDSLVHGNGGP